MTATARRVDAHHHVWDLAVRDQPWTAELPSLRRSFSFSDLEPHLNAHAIDGTVVVQTVVGPEETPELLASVASNPRVLGVVGWVDLTAADVTSDIERLRSGPGGDKLAGIRHQVQQEVNPGWLCRSDVQKGLAAVAGAGLVYDLLVLASQLPATIQAVSALPNVHFVLDHAGKPEIRSYGLRSWQRCISELASFENIDCKLSGLVTEAQPGWTVQTLRAYVDVLLQSFGPGRLMYGSDWPVCLLSSSYDEVIETAKSLTSRLSVGEQAAIFGSTAIRAYGLTP